MQRVLVIGISGAGKSTFSRALANTTGLPLIHLDKEFWQPGWVQTPRPEWRAKVGELAARERWIMDGNYDSSLDLRLPRADTVLWFDYPMLRCLRRAMWRAVTSLWARASLIWPKDARNASTWSSCATSGRSMPSSGRGLLRRSSGSAVTSIPWCFAATARRRVS